MWSSWPWVSTIATTRRPPTAAAIADASWAASMTSTSASSPTSQTLLSTSQVPPSRLNVPEVTTRSTVIRRRRRSAGPRRAPSCGTPPRPRRGAMVSDTNLSRGSRPCWCRSTSIGKSREGRQSPYQDDLIEPPRPKISMSGVDQTIVGLGTPTSTVVPARSRASHACWNTSGRPTASMVTSAPNSVISLMAATGSVVVELTVWVAPNSRAHSSFRSSMSTAMICRAPASSEPGDGRVADAAAAEDRDGVAATDTAGVDGRAEPGHHAAAEQPDHGSALGRRVDLRALTGGHERLLGERADAEGGGERRCRRAASSSGSRCGC